MVEPGQPVVLALVEVATFVAVALGTAVGVVVLLPVLVLLTPQAVRANTSTSESTSMNE